jgi:LacI family transcriptional regulator
MARLAVALLIESSNAYARGLLQGIIEYQRQPEGWSIFFPEQERGATPPRWLRQWQGDGVIARIETETIARSLSRIGIPVVDVSAARRIEHIPWVETDDAKVACLAAEHLIERGFRHFAYCGDSTFNWSRWRSEAFVHALNQRSFGCELYDTAEHLLRPTAWPQQRRRLAKWLKALPKPVGLMASYDNLALQILDICRDLEIPVPDEVAVIGVDNDPIVCNLADPSLSSVIPDAVGAGYRAAELLATMMHGGQPKQEKYLLPPLGIATRQSTDIFAVEDEDIRRTAKFIRDHACSGITVLDLLREIPLSRRVLESRFRKATGQTPHEAILAQRLRRVEELLRESDLSLEAIAAKTGFEHPEYMHVAFRKHFRMPPGRYRSQLRNRTRSSRTP